jgi:hypothetical protein
MEVALRESHWQAALQVASAALTATQTTVGRECHCATATVTATEAAREALLATTAASGTAAAGWVREGPPHASET